MIYLKEKLEAIRQLAEEKLLDASSRQEIEDLRVQILGKNYRHLKADGLAFTRRKTDYGSEGK